VRVVISSAWRVGMKFNLLVDALAKACEISPSYFIGVTGRSARGPQRGHEIQAWLDAHPEVTTFMILDDDNDMVFTPLLDSLVQTSWSLGLEPLHVDILTSKFA
jgi:hypothetical protein